MKIQRRVLKSVLSFTVAVIAATVFTSAQANTIDLGAAGQYTVLGLSNTFVNLHNVTVTGDVGVGPGGYMDLKSPSTVNGDVDLDTNALTTGARDGIVTGSINLNQDVNQAVVDAINASAYYGGLTATLTLGNVTTAQTIVGNGGLNVISITNLNLSSVNLTLQGGANDVFVLNISGGFDMGGSAEIVSNLGVDCVLLNVLGTGSKVTTKVDNMVYGTLLAPQRSGELHSLTGRVILGGDELKLMSGATVVIPEPTTGVMVFMAMLGAGCVLRRRPAQQ